MTITTRKVQGSNKIIVTFIHETGKSSSVSVAGAEDEARAIKEALGDVHICKFLETMDEIATRENAKDRLESLLNSLSAVRTKITVLKEEHSELSIGHRMAFGAILNSYTECDMTFVEAVEELNKVGRKEYGNK
ncbi:MAG: hypothetical protein DRN14_07175 [Thermoplasmata archaeon]|nr:MAG: hypothetical protein DRN14_07175 [Thermoplasmata archaeon]